MPDLTLTTYDAAGAKELISSVVVPVYEQVYSHEIDTDPFFSVERFLQRFRGYSGAPGFAMTVATTDSGAPGGYIFGYALGPGARWWNGLVADVPAGFAAEDGHRTWAVNEIMVIQRLRRRGVATALHDEMLRRRTESRATLLVEPENEPAKSAYASWGWKAVGNLQPFPDSPTFVAMIKDLPL